VPLAAALEARALGVLGAARDARGALDRAEAAVSRLEPDALVPSAFGYNEAQLRFHEGNTLTHLRDTRAAWAAQDQALQLYPERDHLDRSLVELDRATCLAHDGDAASALGHATQTLVRLTDDERSGLILLRARQVLDGLPRHQRALPQGCELEEILVTTDSSRPTS
jgi:tetratricopeptide (TPR) repeat protein